MTAYSLRLLRTGAEPLPPYAGFAWALQLHPEQQQRLPVQTPERMRAPGPKAWKAAVRLRLTLPEPWPAPHLPSSGLLGLPGTAFMIQGHSTTHEQLGHISSIPCLNFAVPYFRGWTATLAAGHCACIPHSVNQDDDNLVCAREDST